MTRIPTSRTLGAAVCLTVALAACGGGSTGSAGAPAGTPSGGTPSAAAPSSAAAAAPEVGSTVTGSDLAAKLTAAMAASPSASLALKVSGGDGGAGTGSLSYAADGSSVQLVLDQATGDPVTMIQVPGALYVDAAGTGAPDGKKWVRISEVKEDSGLFSALFGILALGTTSFSNPDGTVRAVGGTDSLTVKAADAEGVTYTATLGGAQAALLFPLALFGGDEKARQKTAAQSAGEKADLTLVTDASGRPTSISYAVVSDGTKATITTTYSDWGSAKPVTEPEKSVVIEAAEMDELGTS